MRKSVLGAGLVAVDHVFMSKRRGSYTYLGSSGGGSVSNTLCMLSLLGCKTYIFGVVGNDYPQLIVESDFAKFGVDHRSLVSKGGPKDLKQTRQFSHVVYTNTGRHAFRKKCLWCKQPFPRDIQMIKEDLDDRTRGIASKADVVHIDRANEATKDLATIAVKNQHQVSFDLGFESYGPYQKRTSEILELSTLVTINEPVFAKHIGAEKEEGIRLWWERYPDNRYLLVTCGRTGIYGFATIGSEKRPFKLKAIPCDHFRDSAGAGDILTALAIHSLLLGPPPSDVHDLQVSLSRGQALASLNCSLYGARSLQFVFLDQSIRPRRIITWADEILKIGRSGNSFFPLIGLRQGNQFANPSRLAPFRVCKVCGMPLTRRSASLIRKRSIGHVNLDFIPWTMIDGFYVGRNYRSTLTRLTRAPNIFVGSGGSLSASAFGEQLVLRIQGRPAKALPPFEFEGFENLHEDTVVWLLSYGGDNPDIMGAAMNAAKLGVRNCIVLTGARKSRLAEFAEGHSWHTVFLRAEERGFVSTVGMLAMISALVGILATDGKIDEMVQFFNEINLYNIVKNADRASQEISANFSNNIGSDHIVALASGWGWPAMVDFESKIVEGGICTIEISEIKNFTHGRYINALYHRKNRHFILFSSPSESELVSFFHRKLRRYFPRRLDIVRTDLPDIQGALDLIIQAISLAFRLGEKEGRNLLRPRYPPEARGLYGWEPSLRGEDESS